jgi:hypothetical protein
LLIYDHPTMARAAGLFGIDCKLANNRALQVAIAVSAIAATACSRSETTSDRSAAATSDTAQSSRASSAIASCDRVYAQSGCSEYSGSYLASSEAFLVANCRKLSGTFASAACPNTSVLGTCALATGEQRKLYASGGAGYDADRAQRECEEAYRGRWTPLR